ncbi:MAG: hypothetical protein SFW36_17975 [Leptolyngbyaceae cyanobacterium bins.59]|nr:hypothetical protein [Leptolyngbyaceae cyanobacterium bins.59]
MTIELKLGDRIQELSGTPSQRVGTVIAFKRMAGRRGVFPLVCWDSGFTTFTSPAYGLTKVQPGQQLTLFCVEERIYES